MKLTLKNCNWVGTGVAVVLPGRFAHRRIALRVRLRAQADPARQSAESRTADEECHRIEIGIRRGPGEQFPGGRRQWRALSTRRS